MRIDILGTITGALAQVRAPPGVSSLVEEELRAMNPRVLIAWVVGDNCYFYADDAVAVSRILSVPCGQFRNGIWGSIPYLSFSRADLMGKHFRGARHITKISGRLVAIVQ